MTYLITRLAVWWLRRHSPAHLAQSAQRRRRAQSTNNEQNQRRWFVEIDERMAKR